MIETRSLASLNEKVSTISRTTYQHEQEIREIHQKFDAVTNVLQTLSETMQSPTKAGNKWQQRPSLPVRPSSPIVISQQESTLTRRLTLTFCHCNSTLLQQLSCYCNKFLIVISIFSFSAYTTSFE